MQTLTIALAQIDLLLGQPERNLATARAQAAQAQARGADIVVLPELWASAYDLEHGAAYASALGTGMFAEIERIAREYHIAIVGSLLESDGARLYNTATYVDNQGHRLGAYRKLHLVPMLDEDKYLAGGDAAPIWDAPFGKFALAVCYDLRFPELWRHYALGGAHLVFLPAEWPIQRIAHWRTLLPARAIENQFYVVSTNRVGKSKDQTFGGHSMIVNPWGDILVEGDEGEALLIASIDLDLVAQVRERVPVFKDRRAEVYGKWGRQS
jgi:predicted amidohydrolase